MTPPRRNRPFVLGVTGNIASGKSTVTAHLAELGAETIDADRVYHELIRPDSPLWSQLVTAFGQRILGAGRQIDRAALGDIVFADPRRLAELDQLTHPAVVAAIEQRVTTSRAPLIAIDAVKLIESGLDRLCDVVWLIDALPETRTARIVARNHINQEAAARRVAAQPDSLAKRARANLIIDNNGTREELLAAVDAAWSALPILPVRE